MAERKYGSGAIRPSIEFSTAQNLAEQFIKQNALPFSTGTKPKEYRIVFSNEAKKARYYIDELFNSKDGWLIQGREIYSEKGHIARNIFVADSSFMREIKENISVTIDYE